MEKNLVMQRINELLKVSLSEGQYKDYVQKVIILLIDVLRHICGDEFSVGFLEGAINSIENRDEPIMKMVKKQELH